MTTQTTKYGGRRQGKAQVVKLMLKHQMENLKPGQSIAVISAKSGLTKIIRNSDQIEGAQKCLTNQIP